MFTALIAEDEPVLADALQRQLRQLWPALNVVATTGDGLSLVRLAQAHLPDVVFADIHMPGQSGLDATEQLAEHWPLDRPLPLLCFITAYDHYAVTAFERAAVDYVLKPVRAERLALTCSRLQQQLATRQIGNGNGGAATHPSDPDWPQHWPAISQAARGTAPAEEPLRILQANAGQSLYMVDTQDVIYLEAADKYVRIVVRQPPPGVGELLIRTPLKELMPRLPADQFWQIHRSVVVNARAIERVSRQQQKLRVHLRDHPDVLDVSRMHAHLFKAL
jgi:DNA-binding LytR/AlgR family response regulator